MRRMEGEEGEGRANKRGSGGREEEVQRGAEQMPSTAALH